MAETSKVKGFAGAMKEFFGLLPGQDVMAFGRELKALSPAEKKDLSDMLQKHVPHTPPTAS